MISFPDIQKAAPHLCMRKFFKNKLIRLKSSESHWGDSIQRLKTGHSTGLCVWPRGSHSVWQAKHSWGAVLRKGTSSLPPPSKLRQLSGHRPQLPALQCFDQHGTLLESHHHGFLLSQATSLPSILSRIYMGTDTRMTVADWKQPVVLHCEVYKKFSFKEGSMMYSPTK